MDRLHGRHPQQIPDLHRQPLHQHQHQQHQQQQYQQHQQHQHQQHQQHQHQLQQQQQLPQPLQHEQQPLQHQHQHLGLQVDSRLQQQSDVSSPHHPHALRSLQSASPASSTPSPAGYHPNLALPNLHVMNPGGPLAQNINNQPQQSSGPMQYHHPLAPHPHPHPHPHPPPPSSNPPLQQHQPQSHPPIQSSLPLPPQQLSQNVTQRQSQVPLRPMPPPSLSAAPSSSNLHVVVSSTLPSSSSPSSSPLDPQPTVDPNQAGVIAGGSQFLSSGVDSPTVPGTTGPSPLSRPTTSVRVPNTNPGITPGATSQVAPVKDQDGKFPCPHCPKTYLHAKHLKRHLLRHTGDRPYQCVLCKDTFSRSDILKRHFQKCSIRRGNPTGATHLSHAHAHQQGKQGNNQNADVGIASSASSTTVGGLSPSTSSPGGKKKSTRACDQCVRLKVRCDLASPCERCRTKGGECTYSRSIKGQDLRDEGSLLPPATFAEQVNQTVGYSSEEFNFPPPVHPQAHMALQGHQQQNIAGSQHQSQPLNPNQQQPQQVNDISQAPPPNTNFYTNSQAPNGEVDWSPFIQVGDPGFMNPFYLSQAGGSSADSGTPSTTASMEHANGGEIFGTLYNGGSDTSAMSGFMSGFNGWVHLPMHQIDPLQAKCDRLIAICFPESLDRSSPGNGSPDQQIKQEPGADSDLKSWLTPDNVKHFVHLFFTNFQSHFPMIHIPTFNITRVYDGLLLAIICIGAVYSTRGITVGQVRSLIDRSFGAIDRNKVPPGPLEVEEIQGRYFLHILATWHGHHHQRENSRRRYGKVIQEARRAGLFQPLTPENPGSSGFSVCHQLDDHLPARQNWDWLAWVEQEKRNRVMFGIFLLNTAFVIFFNSPPQIQLHEVRLSLPADDAAWEALDANECANCLGLNGADGIGQNISGSRQVRQPEFTAALRSLLQLHLDFNPGITNAYSKFILIHALHVHIWTTQKNMASASEMGIIQTVGSMGVGLVEWKMEDQNRNGIPEGFGDSGMAVNDAAKALRLTQFAFEKWKRAWDTDLITQYPSPTSRVGFCRDGLPFYWLGKLYLARNRTLDWKHGIDDDRTVAKVKNMLKHVQGFITDGTGRLDLQGAVSAIDECFAMDELTYDMKLLFRPIE